MKLYIWNEIQAIAINLYYAITCVKANEFLFTMAFLALGWKNKGFYDRKKKESAGSFRSEKQIQVGPNFLCLMV